MNVLDVDNLNDIFNIDGEDFSEQVEQVVENSAENKQQLAIETVIDNPEINVNRVYSELDNLTKVGTETLRTAQDIMSMTGDAESISGVTNIIDSLKSVIHEFNMINMQNIKHQQNIELENIKLKNKIKLEEKKAQLKATKDIDDSTPVIKDAVMFNTEDCVANIVSMLNKK
jgi:hypothetical protein